MDTETRTNTISKEYLPGNTILLKAEHQADQEQETVATSLALPLDRKAIILATNDVNDETLFINGLTQNIVVLYHLFESLGYRCYLLQSNNNNGSEKKQFIRSYRVITAHDIIYHPIPIRAFIEVGMSIDAPTRQYLRSIGATIAKLYLGNILNIDVETVQCYQNMFFNHHLVGEIDEIWTSPHYYQHVDYAAIINRTSMDNSRVVPYVWDSCFLTQYGQKEQMEWQPPSHGWQTQDFVMMDPNISFQKCSFYSLLLIEAFAKQHPAWRGKVHVINGDRLNISSNARNNFLPSLTLYRDNRIVLYGRKKIHTILQEHRSACFITHQWNNDYNYMTLELLYCHYPILHNSEGWSEYGYYYSIDQWQQAVNTMYNALTHHSENLNIYKTHAARLMWKHSVHHPAVQARWNKILDP